MRKYFYNEKNKPNYGSTHHGKISSLQTYQYGPTHALQEFYQAEAAAHHMMW